MFRKWVQWVNFYSEMTDYNQDSLTKKMPFRCKPFFLFFFSFLFFCCHYSWRLRLLRFILVNVVFKNVGAAAVFVVTTPFISMSTVTIKTGFTSDALLFFVLLGRFGYFGRVELILLLDRIGFGRHFAYMYFWGFLHIVFRPVHSSILWILWILCNACPVATRNCTPICHHFITIYHSIS